MVFTPSEEKDDEGDLRPDMEEEGDPDEVFVPAPDGGGGGEGKHLLNPPAKVGVGNRDLIPPRSQEEIDYASQLGDKLWGNNNQTPSNTGWFDAG